MNIETINTRLLTVTDNLTKFITEHIPKLNDKDIIIITSKVVSLSEGRISALENKEGTIISESDFALKNDGLWLTIKDGMCMTSAGIDESNANSQIILLPRDSYQSADLIRTDLLKYYNISQLGVIVTDSRTMLMRSGSIGVAIGYAGFKGIKNYLGEVDLFGRELKNTKVNIADSLAAAAVVLMGEGSELKPLALIKGAPVQFQPLVDQEELKVSILNDMYVSFFRNMQF